MMFGKRCARISIYPSTNIAPIRPAHSTSHMPNTDACLSPITEAMRITNDQILISEISARHTKSSLTKLSGYAGAPVREDWQDPVDIWANKYIQTGGTVN